MLGYFVLFYLVQYCTGFGVPDPKYVAIMDSPMYPAGEESSKYVDTSKVVVKACNESVSLMYGKIEFKKGLERVIMGIELRKEASGKHETIFSHDICDFCSEIGDESSQYYKYLKHFGIPDHCPVEPGEYEIHNFFMDTSEFEMNNNHLGRYLAVLSVFESIGESCQNDKKLLFQLIIELIIEEIFE